jgi:hypothetical protein
VRLVVVLFLGAASVPGVWAYQLGRAAEANQPAAESPQPVSESPRQFSGLHITFPREWHPSTYEVGSPTSRPPLRLVCDACPALNWVLNRPSDKYTVGEGLFVNAATFGAIALTGGSGKVKLVEWDP